MPPHDELRRLAEAAGGGTWTPSPSGRLVNATNAKIGGETPICEIRGWGYLTGKGHGALGLSEAEAIAVQRALAAYIAAANPARILALLDEVDACNKAHEHTSLMLGAKLEEITRLRAGLSAAIRAAELALFVIRKQGVMPNASWENGFNRDLKTAKEAKGSTHD